MKELTKTEIAKTFLNLLDRKPIGRITIKEICTECDINRQTFYYHFQDIYDLCFWITERNLRTYIEESCVDRSDTKKYLYVLFEYFLKSKNRICHAYDAMNRVQYESLFKERAKPIIMQRLLSYDEAKRVESDDIDFLASFYTLSLSGLFIKWVEEGLPDEYHVRLDNYCMIVDGSMKTLLLKFAKKQMLS